MKTFYSLRLKKHQKKMLGYLKYVLNDHLVLALTFILGGLGLYYSQFVKTLTPSFTLGYLIIWVVLVLGLHIGRVATLVEPADSVFLLPKEQDMSAYLAAGYRHSLFLPLLILTGLSFILSPLLFVLNPHFKIVALLLIMVTVAILKMVHLQLLIMSAYRPVGTSSTPTYLVWLTLSGLILAVALWFPLLALGLSLLFAAGFFKFSTHAIKHLSLNWESLIKQEQLRLNRIYRFINLFTDVPGITPSVKRRRHLDFLLQGIPQQSAFTFDFLFTRHLVRGSDYGGLVFRLLTIGLLVIYFVKNPLLAMGLCGLIIFLIGFQLLPLPQAFAYVSAAQLYPVLESERHRSLGRLVQKVLLGVSLLFSILAIIVFTDKLIALLFTAGLFIESLIFARFYLPKRLQKMAKF